MPRVVFVNRYFHPDHSATSQLLGDLAFDLAARGRDVAVVSGRQLYDEPHATLAARETVMGVAVRRVRGTRFGRARLVGRALDAVSFYPGAALALCSLVRRGDIVVAKTDPPLVSVLAAVVAGVRGARLVNWLQDLYPEVPEALGVPLVRGPVAWVLRAMRDASLRAGAVNVVLGEAMAERVRSRGVSAQRIRTIPNWADGRAIAPIPLAGHPLRAAWGLNDRFVVGYAGNLGRAHDADTVLGAARLLCQDPSIAFLFIGGGKGRGALEKTVAGEGLANFVFRPYQARAELGLALTVADVHLVTLRPALEGLIVPSKLYGAMAAGRAVVFVGDPNGEVARLVRTHECGVVARAGDAEALATAIRGLRDDPALGQRLGANARRTFERLFDREHALASWRAVLES
ncbi:MAG: glycosyltransferase family 4 protein [Alphaproteobacteria bacterium]